MFKLPVPRFDADRLWRDAVETVICPVCYFAQRPGDRSAPRCNDGSINCPRCGLVQLPQDLLMSSTMRPLSLMDEAIRSEANYVPKSILAQLVREVLPILTFLGPGNLHDSWNFLKLTSTNSLSIQRRFDNAWLLLDFTVLGPEGCQSIAEMLKFGVTAGVDWWVSQWEELFGCDLSWDFKALFETLDQHRWFMWRKDQQEFGNTHWARARLGQPADKLMMNGIRLHMSWR